MRSKELGKPVGVELEEQPAHAKDLPGGKTDAYLSAPPANGCDAVLAPVSTSSTRGLALEGALDRLLGGLVVVLVDLLVVGRFPVDEDAHQDAVVVGLVLRDHARGDRVDHGARHRRLRGAEHLDRLLGALDRHLVEEDGVGLGGQVGRHHRQERREAVLVVREGVHERLSRRTALGSDDEVDVGDLVAFPDQRFTDEEVRCHGSSS